MSFLIEQCTFFELTEDVLATCQPFSCGNADLDDFFQNDATRFAYYLMGKTYKVTPCQIGVTQKSADLDEVRS